MRKEELRPRMERLEALKDEFETVFDITPPETSKRLWQEIQRVTVEIETTLVSGSDIY